MCLVVVRCRVTISRGACPHTQVAVFWLPVEGPAAPAEGLVRHQRPEAGVAAGGKRVAVPARLSPSHCSRLFCSLQACPRHSSRSWSPASSSSSSSSSSRWLRPPRLLPRPDRRPRPPPPTGRPLRLRSLRCLPSLFSGRLPFLPSYPLRWIPSQLPGLLRSQLRPGLRSLRCSVPSWGRSRNSCSGGGALHSPHRRRRRPRSLPSPPSRLRTRTTRAALSSPLGPAYPLTRRCTGRSWSPASSTSWCPLRACSAPTSPPSSHPFRHRP